VRTALDFACQYADNNEMKTETAINHFGSREALASALGISRQMTYQFGENIPLLRQYQLQVITDGKLVADNPDERIRPTADQAA
jgi:hypothetical protein